MLLDLPALFFQDSHFLKSGKQVKGLFYCMTIIYLLLQLSSNGVGLDVTCLFLTISTQGMLDLYYRLKHPFLVLFWCFCNMFVIERGWVGLASSFDCIARMMNDSIDVYYSGLGFFR